MQTLKKLFIDAAKIEANANRYTFVWSESINYHLAGLLDSIDNLYSSYNSFLKDNGVGEKYEFGNAQMFVINGIDKVRDVIEKNRTVIHKHMKYMDIHTLVDVNINLNAYTNMTLIKILIRTR